MKNRIWSTSQAKDAFGLAVERWMIARQDTADIPIPLQIHLNSRIHTSLLFQPQLKRSNLQFNSQYSYFPIGLQSPQPGLRYQTPDARSKSEARKHFSNPTLLHTQERSSLPVSQSKKFTKHCATQSTSKDLFLPSLSLDRK